MKTVLGVVAGFAAVVTMLVAGCTQQQVVVVARQAGLASIVTWIGVDNPTDVQKATASQVVSLIKTNASSVSAGGSYYSVLYPVVTEYVQKYVPAQSKPIATLAGGWVLTGVDTFFAMYPTYGANAGQALQVVDAFCDGTLQGLAMAKNDPIIVAATKGAKTAAKARGIIQ